MHGSLLLDEAMDIADRLAADAVWHRGRCTWVTRRLALKTRMKADSHPVLEALDHSVYSGTAGVGLFLARASRYSGDASHKRAAAGAIEHALDRASREGERTPLTEANRLGYFTGVLGVCAAAHEVAGLTGERALDQSAQSLLRRALASADGKQELDIMAGNAGAIPALLALPGTAYAFARDAAVALGDELLARANRHDDNDAWSWSSYYTRRMRMRDYLGFSHGSGGVGWALATLYASSGEARFRDAAYRAFAYEAKFFDAEEGNWPHFSDKGLDKDGEYRFSSAWCHGAPGIGLSRALSAPLLEDASLLDTVRTAIRTTERGLHRELEIGGRDATLCHGIFGSADCHITMALAVDRERLAALRDAAALMVERYGRPARKRWGSMEYPTCAWNGYQPSLALGLAGIGHTFLRLHEPDAVPSALVPGWMMRAE